MPSENELKRLITRALGAADAERTVAYQFQDLSILGTTAQQLTRMMSSTSGTSVATSAAWALRLRDKYNIPAVAVAGDLRVAGRWLFRTTDALPEFRTPDVPMRWRGHCWVEIGGKICDVSIFRSVYGLSPDDAARKFCEERFGVGHAALILDVAEIPDGLQYRRRAVLTQRQMIGAFECLRMMIEGEKPQSPD